MRRLVLVWLALVGVLLVLFVAVELAGVPLLTDPGRHLRRASIPVAVVGVSLLIVDAFLPVASSAVMLLHGAVFGVAGGAVLSTCGALGSLALAAWIGRRGVRRMAPGVSGEHDPRVAELLQRYGTAAVILSRPVPILAESVAMVAGATGMPWWRLLLAGTAGIVPLSLVYALAGARSSQAGGTVAAAVVVLLAGAALALSAVRHRREARRSTGGRSGGDRRLLIPDRPGPRPVTEPGPERTGRVER